MSLVNKLVGLREIWRFDNRWELIAERILRPREAPTLYRLENLKVLIDHGAGDANGTRHILTSTMYRRFLPLLGTSAPLTVLDLGANGGGFPLLLKLEGFTFRRLVAVEFNPRTFARLKVNIETNVSEDFELLNVAVCGENRPVGVVLDRSGTSDNIYSAADAAVDQTVEGLTLDEIFDRAIGSSAIVDLCKMDIEGAEFEIFAGSHCESIRRCRNLIIEIHHSAKTPRDRVLERLGRLGFEERGGGERREGRHYVHFLANQRI